MTTATAQKLKDFHTSKGYDLAQIIKAASSGLDITNELADYDLDHTERIGLVYDGYPAYSISMNGGLNAYGYVKDNVVRAIDYDLYQLNLSIDDPLAIRISNTWLTSGDENESQIIADELPRISYGILLSLIERSDQTSEKICSSNAGNRLAPHLRYLKLIDSTQDDRVLSAHTFSREKFRSLSEYNRSNCHKMHKQGYSLVTNVNDYAWHRPASYLFAYGKNQNKRYFVMGQDESQYFGSELPAGVSPKNLAEAFRALQPPVVQSAKRFMRQGEWFAVPVPESKIPDPFGPEILVHPTDGCVTLPKDDESSANHVLSGDIRVTRDGHIYASNFEVSHSNGDHQDMTADNDDWWEFHRNTAVTSYSDKGMD